MENEKNKNAEISEPQIGNNELKTSSNQQKVNNKIVSKIANLLFVISAISLIFTGFIAFSFLGLILYYLMLVIVLFLTLFTTFNKVKEWFEKGEVIQEFLGTTFQYLPYSIGIGVTAAIVALILYITNKGYIHRTSKIITTSVVLFLYAVFAVLRLVVFAGN